MGQLLNKSLYPHKSSHPPRWMRVLLKFPVFKVPTFIKK